MELVGISCLKNFVKGEVLGLNIQGEHRSLSQFPFPPKPPIRSLAQLQIVLHFWRDEMPPCV